MLLGPDRQVLVTSGLILPVIRLAEAPYVYNPQISIPAAQGWFVWRQTSCTTPPCQKMSKQSERMPWVWSQTGRQLRIDSRNYKELDVQNVVSLQAKVYVLV